MGKTRNYYSKRGFSPFVPDRAYADVPDEEKMFKVKPGWYRIFGLHIVETRAVSKDGGIDWIAVKRAVDAFKVYHGNAVEYQEIHNTRRDLVAKLRRFRRGVA